MNITKLVYNGNIQELNQNLPESTEQASHVLESGYFWQMKPISHHVTNMIAVASWHGHV